MDFDLNSNFDFLINNNIESAINNKIIEQENTLDSNKFNISFKYIEDSLNYLYEKARVLQDIINYSNEHFLSEINNSIQDCKELYSQIQDDKDLVKNNTYIKYPVSLSNLQTTDRDNSSLNSIINYNSSLTNSDNIIYKYNITNVSILDNINRIYSATNTLLTANYFRSMYCFDKIQSSYIYETININFDKSIKLNKINYTLSNCLIDKIKLVLEDNSIEYLNINQLNLFETKNVKSIEIILKTSNYILSQLKYNNTNFDLFLNKISTDENLYVDKQKYYYYLFGLDNLEFLYVEPNYNCGFISQDINIGQLKANEHISIYSEEQITNGNAEYYIISNDVLYNILPENITYIKDEKLFYNKPTRFAINNNEPITIKCNGNITTLTYEQAINKQDNNIYTISYTPISSNIMNDFNDTIKLKVILRAYDNYNPNYINNLKIKKYGGNNLWTV